MGRVASILERKGRQVHTVGPEAIVYDAVALMVRQNVGSLLVTDDGRIQGIFTERDFLRRVTLQDRQPKWTRVRDVMTERVIVVEPHTTIEDCMSIMTRERIRHLPVVEHERVVGIISIGDLVKHLSSEREVEIRYLTEFITGAYPGPRA
jgi:CBS domain-containing protein